MHLNILVQLGSCLVSVMELVSWRASHLTDQSWNANQIKCILI